MHQHWFSTRCYPTLLLPKRLRRGRHSAWFPHSVPILWLYPVLTITFALVPPKCVTSINAIKQTDFILSIKCRVAIVSSATLIAFCQCPKTNYKGLIGSIHSNCLPTSSSGMYSASCSEGYVYIRLSKNGHCFQLTRSQNV